MKNKIKHFSALSGAVVVASLLVGCQDFDADHSYSDLSQVVFNQEYADNFIKEYGDLSQVKSWDLSSLGDELNYLGNETRTQTNAFSNKIPGGGTYSYSPLSGCTDGDPINICEISELNTTIASATQSNKTYYNLPNATFDWLTNNMTEGAEHSSTDIGERSVKADKQTWAPIVGAGHNFTVKEPDGDFWLLPIYQGYALSTFDLHLVMNNVDYKVWTKGQGLEILRYIYTYTADFVYTAEDGTEKTYHGKIGTKYCPDSPDYAEGASTTVQCAVKSATVTGPNANKKYTHEYVYWLDGKNGNTTGKVTLESSSATAPSNVKVPTVISNVTNEKTGEKWEKLASHTTSKDYNTLAEAAAYTQAVRCQPIHFKKEAFEGCGEFFFYLEITSGIWNDLANGESDAAIPGTKQRSDKGMMAALDAKCEDDIAAITGETENLNAIILGCEAANRTSSDYDYNDIVFLMIGNPVPTILESFDRRYLCEDLGSTYDFDFNDVVVDVSQRQQVNSKFELTPGETYKGEWKRTLSNKTQSVSIAHMCGTIPFQVYVGNPDKTQAGFRFPKMKNPNAKGRNANDGYTPTSSEADVAKYCLSYSMENDAENWWNPATNNIYIDVWPYDDGTKEGGSSTVIHTVAFPKYNPGELGEDDKPVTPSESGTIAPQIIAVDPTVNWMGEHVHIPTSWVNAAKTLDIKNETTTNSSTTTE